MSHIKNIINDLHEKLESVKENIVISIHNHIVNIDLISYNGDCEKILSNLTSYIFYSKYKNITYQISNWTNAILNYNSDYCKLVFVNCSFSKINISSYKPNRLKFYQCNVIDLYFHVNMPKHFKSEHLHVTNLHIHMQIIEKSVLLPSFSKIFLTFNSVELLKLFFICFSLYFLFNFCYLSFESMKGDIFTQIKNTYVFQTEFIAKNTKFFHNLIIFILFSFFCWFFLILKSIHNIFLFIDNFNETRFKIANFIKKNRNKKNQQKILNTIILKIFIYRMPFSFFIFYLLNAKILSLILILYLLILYCIHKKNHIPFGPILHDLIRDFFVLEILYFIFNLFQMHFNIYLYLIPIIWSGFFYFLYKITLTKYNNNYQRLHLYLNKENVDYIDDNHSYYSFYKIKIPQETFTYDFHKYQLLNIGNIKTSHDFISFLKTDENEYNLFKEYIAKKFKIKYFYYLDIGYVRDLINIYLKNFSIYFIKGKIGIIYLMLIFYTILFTGANFVFKSEYMMVADNTVQSEYYHGTYNKICSQHDKCETFTFEDTNITIPRTYGEYNAWLYTIEIVLSPFEFEQSKKFQTTNELSEILKYFYRILGIFGWLVLFGKIKLLFIDEKDNNKDDITTE